ncbi:hypothetical protein VTK73DRAFT_9205 [Phialemonium thermophilum]|uniref:Uncharacterized protein n=1 Tax=Phialemonium thermophilum TaxID=223376 RepID=A0ABR3XLH5_9PEZI
MRQGFVFDQSSSIQTMNNGVLMTDSSLQVLFSSSEKNILTIFFQLQPKSNLNNGSRSATYLGEELLRAYKRHFTNSRPRRFLKTALTSTKGKKPMKIMSSGRLPVLSAVFASIRISSPYEILTAVSTCRLLSMHVSASLAGGQYTSRVSTSDAVRL